MPDPRLESLRARFGADPRDAVAFEALEESAFVGGRWEELVGLYEQRLRAPDLLPEKNAKGRARLLLRLAQVLDERCGREADALVRYREAAGLDRSLRAALGQLRRIHARRGEWELALQVGETEAQLPLRPFEVASLQCELAEVWRAQLGDAERALALYQRALDADPDCVAALLGLARIHEAGEPARAVPVLERAAGRLKGVDRAAVWVRLARIAEKHQGDRARATELYRRAATDDPRNAEALEVLAARAEEAAQWELYGELQERRFALAENMLQRLAIAHEAGRSALEKRRDPMAARHWFRRAQDLFPDDPVVHLYLADVERMSGNSDALASHLRRASELADNATPADVLHESAQLASERGDTALAISQLRQALDRSPTRAELYEELAGMLARAGRDTDLVDLLETWIAQTPPGSDALPALWLRLGQVHEEQVHDVDAALASYEEALASDPAYPEALDAIERVLRKEDRFEALRTHLARGLAAAAGRDRAREAYYHCALGELAIHPFEDLDAARAAFEAALALDERNARARQGLERVALALGDDDAILGVFEREAADTTDRARLAFLVGELARIHEERGAPDLALGWAERLVAADPQNRAALERCARLQEQLGLARDLVATLERLDPLLRADESAPHRRRLASLYAAQGDAEGALEAYRRALAADPDDAQSLRAVVALLERSDRTEELVAALRHLAELVRGAERAALLHALGVLQAERLGDAGAAVVSFEKALAEPGAPADTEPRLIALLERLERWAALADRLAERRARLDPIDPAAFELDVRRAELLLDHLGRPREAIALFDAARETAPGSERARDGLERALRIADDGPRLVALLAERAAQERDRERRALLEMERALLLEQRLQRLPEARLVLAELAEGESSVAAEAELRLCQLLERTGEWEGLRDRLSRRLGGAPQEDAACHRQLAAIERDRLRRPGEAAAHLEQANALEPGRIDVVQALAALYHELDRPQDLVRATEMELALGPDPARALRLHARAAELCETRVEDEAAAERHHRGVLALDPGAAHAVEFLARRYETSGRHADLAELLASRLARQLGQPDELSLRLRLAALQAGPLGDAAAAIATLAPAAERDEALDVVAEPLARLYGRTGRAHELAELARRAANACELAAERAAWQLRLGHALRAQGDPAGAADAYRRALADRPDLREAEAALREVYRELQQAEPLARLLSAELSRVGGSAEIPLRLELAELLSEALAKPGEALVHLRRVVELDGRQPEVLARAVALAERSGAHADAAELLALAVRRERDPSRRAELLVRRGRILASELDRGDDAIRSFEEALAAAPEHAPALVAMRETEERRGRWAEALACRERELALAPPPARAALARAAAELAHAKLGADAALPWLERVRTLCPEDAAVHAQVAEIHRGAGRSAQALAALEAQLALVAPGAARVALQLERARMLEDAHGAPARAIAALEEALAEAPDATAVLEALDRLYAAQERRRERLGVLERRAALAAPGERLGLRRVVAQLQRELGDWHASAHTLWLALGEDAETRGERASLLRELGELLLRTGRRDLWARAAEAELDALDPQAPVFAERRRTLSLELGRAYLDELQDPDAARRHLEALLADPTSEAYAEAETRVLTLLRRTDDACGLEAHLTRRLERLTGDPSEERAAEWLELAQLRLEKLQRPAAASRAFAEALARDPASLVALRGLRATADLLGHAEQVAETLDRELALRPDASASERASLLRRLGQVSWHALDNTTRASRAFAAALEAEPGDLVSLRSLEELFETMEDWRGAADLYESEVSVLRDAEPERRQAVWLRTGEIAQARLGDPARALRAYEAAAEIGALSLERMREWAELYEANGRTERFAEVLGRWIDAPEARVTAADQLRLAAALEALGRLEEALARATRACELDARLPEAFDRAAALHERLRRPADAAAALDRAAALIGGAGAAVRRVRGAGLLLGNDDDRAAELLEQAVADDPAHAEAHARLALASARLGRLARAERAAERALALDEPQALDASLRLETALVGARAARAQERLEHAVRFLHQALALAPAHPEALSLLGQSLAKLGDAEGARATLERCLALDFPPRDRAVHLVLLAEAEERTGRGAGALARHQAAIELDPTLDDAHAGLARALVQAGRRAEGVAALCAWAERARSAADRAARLLQAAELELTIDGEAASSHAEGLLRQALAANPALPSAWALWCERLWSQGRGAELVERSQEALAQPLGASERARVALLRGRALEQRGDAREAAASYATACESDARCAEGALAAARLLRGLGEWRDAAEVLRRFVERAPDVSSSLVAPALHQLGRLLAGPLEDVPGAVDVYRRALAADPELREAQEALADLLVHQPRQWDEAVKRHQALLLATPARLASLRGLLRIARGRGSDVGVACGLAVVRALGVATPDERSEAPARLPVPIAKKGRLSDPVWEAARRMAQEVAPELAEALGVGAPEANGAPAAEAVARFRQAVIAVEGALSAPALVPLPVAELRAVLLLVAQIGSEGESVQGDGHLVNALSAALTWRSRRRIRKALGEVTSHQVAQIDFAAWREELRALAATTALDDGSADLRTALVAFLPGEGPDGARELPAEADVRERVAALPEARAVLRRVIDAWIPQL